MTQEVIKWINDNKLDVKYAAFGLIIFNCIMIGVAGMSGEFLWLITHLFNIIFANVFFAVPAVYASKLIRSLN